MEFLDVLKDEPTRVKVGASKSPGTIPALTYYSFAGASEQRRIAFLAQAIPWMYVPRMPNQVGSWVYSCLDAVYPGVVREIFEGTTVRARGRALTDDELQFLRDGTRGLELFERATYDADRVETTILELAAVFACMMFAMVKKPTRDNITAFTVNRPRALRDQFALTDEKVSWFRDEVRMFPLDALLNIYGYFSSRYEERRHLATEFVSWSENAQEETRVAMGSVAKLWLGHGENHIKLIHKFLLSYGKYLAGIPMLAEEARRFCVDFRKAGASSEGSYEKAFRGDRAVSIYSRNYPELFKLAREIASRMEDSMSKYASAATSSRFLEQFELACEAADPPAALPAARKVGGGM